MVQLATLAEMELTEQVAAVVVVVQVMIFLTLLLDMAQVVLVVTDWW
jgi:hypothetical protein